MIWIEFLGLPASGKSTHANILAAALRRRGFSAYGRREGLEKCLRARDGILLGASKILAPGVRKRLDNTDHAMPELCAFATRHPGIVAGVLESLDRRQLPQHHRRTWVVPAFRTFAEYQMAADHLAASDIIIHDEGLAHRCFTMFGFLDEPVPRVEIASYLRRSPRIDYAVWTDVSAEISNSRIEKRALGPPRSWFNGLSMPERIAHLAHGRECLAAIAGELEASGVPLLRIDNALPADEGSKTIEAWISQIGPQLRLKTKT